VPERASRRPLPPIGRAPGGSPLGDDQSGPFSAVEPELDHGEELILVLRGIGAAMFLTTERLIVARDGSERRPRSGMQSFPLESISHIRVEPGERPSGRIAVWIGSQEVVSMFFDARSGDRAEDAVAAARPLIARRRRERQAIARRVSD
jgi:hypothetical protein